MLIPSRWMYGGNQTLDKFRTTLIEGKDIKVDGKTTKLYGKHIEKIHNYSKSQDVFNGVKIPGGVQCILLNMQKEYKKTKFYNLKIVNGRLTGDKEKDSVSRDLSKYTYVDKRTKKQYFMIPTDNMSVGVIDAIRKVNGGGSYTYKDHVFQNSPFGIDTNFKDSEEQTSDKDIKVICSGGRITYTSEESIKQHKESISKFKVCVSKFSGDQGGSADSKGKYLVLSSLFILNPDEVCSKSYLVLSTHDNVEEAKRALEYMKTKFVRFLICVCSDMAMTSRNFMFVPYEDFSRQWTDEQLYEKYNLTQDEINYIESSIKPME